MLVVMNESSLPEELVQVLPSDPFEQLDVARKIMSIALSTRVSELQSESSALREELADKDSVVAQLQAQVESLQNAISEAAERLTQADQDKESLVKENASLSNSVRKLSRDVSKLEVFKKTLMQSLQEDEENSGGGAQDIVAKLQSQASITSASQPGGDNDASLPPSRSSSMRAYISETANSFAENQESDATRPRVPYNILLASQTSTPRITPPGSPPSLSASVSPTRRTSKPVSPIRRHSISFSSSRGIYDDRTSVFSSSGSVSNSDTASQTGRTRVDGKEFFRQVRSRLSSEQFGAFLTNVKDLNSQKQTKEETLQKVDEIFGSENKDLYAIFEGLITRNVN
ncbi:hypothetical protein RIF29_40590 [Crotalaria pallida]|uniref:At4g15545-like C-terminal domain-containing protein n=1 Tax=Crotalaria pallida TaxID=3830 RepID=A0AAN9E4Y8_CROPI